MLPSNSAIKASIVGFISPVSSPASSVWDSVSIQNFIMAALADKSNKLMMLNLSACGLIFQRLHELVQFASHQLQWFCNAPAFF